MAELISDEEFASRMRELTGIDDIWDENYVDENTDHEDPDEAGGAAIQSLNDQPEKIDSETPNEGHPPLGKVMTEEEYMNNIKEEDMYSDDSTEMILNVRHLTASYKKGNKSGEHKSFGRQRFLNKARSAVADPPEASRTNEESEAWQLGGWGGRGGVQLAREEYSAEGQFFTPWNTIRKYPYTYVGKRSQDLCKDFFGAEAIFEGRTWDFFYLRNPVELSRQPILFVPTEQFEDFLDFVNTELDISLAIPDGGSRKNFMMSFGNYNTPRPRFLGRCRHHKALQKLRDDVPPLNPKDTLQDCSESVCEDFLNLLEMAHKAGKSEANKVKAEKNRVKRIDNHKAWGQGVKRVQRYLGLRAKIFYPSDFTPIASPKPLDLSRPVPNPMANSIIFVAIDVEAYEFNQNCITEVGLAVLDTKDIAAVAPGQGGENWFPKIHARHIRVQENTWAVNKRHVKGCAHKFDFGISEFVPAVNVAKILDKILTATHPDGQPRTLVLVFHDSTQDVGYLAKLDCNLGAYNSVLEFADTRNMHQHIVRGSHPTKLETVLDYLEIPWKNLHNAGNDAVYTLRAMIGLAVKKRVASLDKFFGGTSHQEENTDQGPLPFNEVADKEEGWSSGGEQTDGGLPDKLRSQW